LKKLITFYKIEVVTNHTNTGEINALYYSLTCVESVRLALGQQKTNLTIS